MPKDVDGDPLEPTPLVQEMLGTPALPDSEAKALEVALTLSSLLHSLGFAQEHIDMAIEYAPNLDVDESVAYLLLHLPDEAIAKLSLSTLEASESQKGHGIELDYASAWDETHPPRHPAYEFERTDPALARPQAEEKPSTAVTQLETLAPGTAEQVWADTQAAISELETLLHADSAWTDVVEHAVDAYCTARIAVLRVDQEKARRSKLLGKAMDDALAEAAHDVEAQRLLAGLATHAKDLMQQAEIQPSFHKKTAGARFKERMQLQQEAKAKTKHEDAQAKRRADIAQALNETTLDEPPAEDPASSDEPPPDDAQPAAEDEPPLPLEALVGTAAEPEPPAAAVHVRSLAAGQGGRSPRVLLHDVMKQVDPHATVRYTAVPTGGSVYRSQLSICRNTSDGKRGAVMVQDTYRLTTEGCSSQARADELVATLALNCLGRDRSVQRSLPLGFRQFWDELEAQRSKEKQALLRNEVGHVRTLLARRAKHDAPAKRPRKRVKGSVPAPLPRAPRTCEPDAGLAEAYKARQASGAYQAMAPGRAQLPIAQSRQRILDSVASSQVVVLSGETGCGKSTQLPAYLLENSLENGIPCKIYVTEPRRISAITLAERVSQELGEKRGAIGGPDSYVGYAIRLDSQIGRNARLVYATTGIALRMLESTGFDDITHMIIDEVHERSIESDFLLMVLKVLMQQRPDLKVVLMSATLDADRISAYFGGCPMLHVPGRTFPVDVHFLEDALELCDYTLEPNSPYALRKGAKQNAPQLASAEGDDDDDEEDERASFLTASTKTYSAKTVDTLAQMNEYTINYELIAALLKKLFTDARFATTSQATLIFLPGIGEIRQCQAALTGDRAFDEAVCQVHILHSSVAPDEQAAAFDLPPPGVRKLVLATNIAETGITIPDITCVIDTGRHREMRYDEKRKISKLVECFVARSNAKQRCGRAGRVQQGVCFHLFTKMRHDEFMDAHPLPEMLRLSLQELALTLKVMRIQVGTSIEDALSQALDAPQAINVQRAVASLVEVQALTPQEEITSLGRHLCHMPLDVHLGKFLLVATRFRCLDAALTITAVLNSKSPFLSLRGTRSTTQANFQAHHSDFFCYINMYRGWRKAVAQGQGGAYCSQHHLSQEILYQIEELRQQYFSYLADTGFVQISKEVRKEWGRGRGRGRPRLNTTPAEWDLYSECPQAVHLAMVFALYPKLLAIDQRTGQMRTLTNHQPAAIHPSSSNFRSQPSGMGTHFVLYYTIMMSRRLYAWETAYVDDWHVLLAGGDAEFRHTCRSIFLDHNRVRMALTDAKALVALRVLRVELARTLQASYEEPGLAWNKESQGAFSLALQALGASRSMAMTGQP